MRSGAEGCARKEPAIQRCRGQHCHDHDQRGLGDDDDDYVDDDGQDGDDVDDEVDDDDYSMVPRSTLS